MTSTHDIDEHKGHQLMPTIAISLTTVVMVAVLALVALAGRMERDELD